MLDVEEIIETYEYIYKQVFSLEAYSLPRTKRNEIMILNFLERVPPSAGKSWLSEYFLFHFFLRSGQRTRFGIGAVNFSWLIGKTAFDRWEKRTSYELENTLLFKIEKKIRFTELSFSPLSEDYKRKERLRYKEGEEQYLHCSFLGLKKEICEECKKCSYESNCGE